MTGGFKELEVWKAAVDLAASVYELASSLPETERYGIRSQICRAAVSISSNIAEGHGRGSNAEFARFVRISMGSLREVQSLVAVAQKLNMIQDTDGVEQQLDRVARMLYGLLNHLGD